jgi:hypothetical protein
VLRKENRLAVHAAIVDVIVFTGGIYRFGHWLLPEVPEVQLF